MRLPYLTNNLHSSNKTRNLHLPKFATAYIVFTMAQKAKEFQRVACFLWQNYWSG